MTEKKQMTLKEKIEEIFWNCLHTVTFAHDNQPNEPHRQVIFKHVIPELIADILKIIEKEKFRAIEEYAKEIIPKINAKWRKRLKAVELDVVLKELEQLIKEKLMEYGVTEASISLKYLKKNPKPLYVVLSQAILKDYIRKSEVKLDEEKIITIITNETLAQYSEMLDGKRADIKKFAHTIATGDVWRSSTQP